MAEGGKIRLSVSFPENIYEKLEQIATKHHRPIGSVVVEACDFFVNEKPVLEAEAIARESPEYRAILVKLREDLGIPPQPLQE